jgi:hypothetical protein
MKLKSLASLTRSWRPVIRFAIATRPQNVQNGQAAQLGVVTGWNARRFIMKIMHTLVAVALVFGGYLPAHAEQPADAPTGLTMSPELLELFRAEMRELLGASQAISLALPVGDWANVAATSEKMRKSYVLEKKLTVAQREELESLPERFKRLDEQFHMRAEKLAHAASQKDAELTAFHYARLLEGCAGCHAIYARQRFPGFASDSVDSHHQH